LPGPPTALSHVRNMDDMKTVLDAIVRRDCVFELVNQDKGDNADDGTHFVSKAS
jgi:hypothetical protein